MGFWSIISHRYRSYLYMIPAIVSIPLAIWFIRTQVDLNDQLWAAAAYMTILMVAVVSTVPYNYFKGSRRRFLKLIDEASMEEVDVPFSVSNPPYPRKMADIEVDGVLVPRTEIIIPSEEPVDVSWVLPSLGKVRGVSLRFHGVQSRRIEFANGVVYYHGTPLDSTNTEIAVGYFVDPSIVLTEEDFGPMATFEVVLFLHGDRAMYTNTKFLDKAFAFWFGEHPEEMKEVPASV